jgi:hypothetical protein
VATYCMDFLRQVSLPAPPHPPSLPLLISSLPLTTFLQKLGFGSPSAPDAPTVNDLYIFGKPVRPPPSPSTPL